MFNLFLVSGACHTFSFFLVPIRSASHHCPLNTKSVHWYKSGGYKWLFKRLYGPLHLDTSIFKMFSLTYYISENNAEKTVKNHWLSQIKKTVQTLKKTGLREPPFFCQHAGLEPNVQKSVGSHLTCYVTKRKMYCWT